VALESVSLHKSDRTSARFSRELTILSPGILVVSVSSHCMYPLILSRPSLTYHFHLAPVRLHASIPNLRKMLSLTIPLSGQSTIPSPEGSTNRTKTNSFPARTRVLNCFSSLGQGVKMVPLGSSCNSSARVRLFVIWHLLGIPLLGKTSRLTIGVFPMAL